MKKCEYCGKQITYFEQYCGDDCQFKANRFYEKSERFGKLFSIVNVICVFGIPVGLFLMSLVKAFGMIIAVSSCTILGLMLILLPFPTDGMISRFKIQKAVKITRYIGAAVIVLGVAIALLAFLLIE